MYLFTFIQIFKPPLYTKFSLLNWISLLINRKLFMYRILLSLYFIFILFCKFLSKTQLKFHCVVKITVDVRLYSKEHNFYYGLHLTNWNCVCSHNNHLELQQPRMLWLFFARLSLFLYCNNSHAANEILHFFLTNLLQLYGNRSGFYFFRWATNANCSVVCKHY